MARPSIAGHRLAVPVSVGVVGLALIMIGQTGPNRHSIEDDLTTRSTEALKSADLTGFSVSFTGRDATLTGSDIGGAAARAATTVESVDGVRVANTVITSQDEVPAPATTPSASTAPTETSPPAPTPTEPPSAAPTAKSAALPVGFTLADGTITVTGTVSSKSAGSKLIDAVKAAGNGWQVVDHLQVDESLTTAEPRPSRLAAVTRLLAQAPTDGQKLVIQYNRGSVILRGTPSDADSERALLAAAADTVEKKSAVVDGLDTP